MPSEGSPRILITRLSHIGDCVVTLPVLCALRRNFPDAFIAWAVEKPSDQLIGHHDALDSLVTVPKGWLKSPRHIVNLRHQLRELNFDITIDPQSLTKSALLARLSGADFRIGLGGKWGREAAPWLNNKNVTPKHEHIVPRSLELLKATGIQKSNIEFNLPLSSSAIDAVESFIRRAHLACGFAVINPGSTAAAKFWEMDRFGVVARHLGQQHGITSVVTWAGDAEKRLAQSIIEHSGGQAVLAPQTNLQELAALLHHSSFYLGSDTGPTHIAAAVGTECIALFAPTRAELVGPYGDSHILIQAEIKEHVSRRKRKTMNNDAMKTITAERVCQACDEMVARQLRNGKTFRAA